MPTVRPNRTLLSRHGPLQDSCGSAPPPRLFSSGCASPSLPSLRCGVRCVVAPRASEPAPPLPAPSPLRPARQYRSARCVASRRQ